MFDCWFERNPFVVFAFPSIFPIPSSLLLVDFFVDSAAAADSVVCDFNHISELRDSAIAAAQPFVCV